MTQQKRTRNMKTFEYKPKIRIKQDGGQGVHILELEGIYSMSRQGKKSGQGSPGTSYHEASFTASFVA
jgi:hypothetical protein